MHGGRKLAERDGYAVIDCEACGWAHLDRLPDEAELAHTYASNYYEVTPGWLAKDRSEAAFWDLEHADKLADWAALLGAETGVLVDVGCAGGLLIEHAAARSWRASGIEPSGLAVAECRRRGLDVREGRYQDVELDGSVDVIHAKLVLEHLHDPRGFVAWAHRALRPGGVLTLQAPNEFNALLQLAARAALDLEPWWVAPPFHINYFDFAALERLLAAGDFEPAGRDATYPMEWFLLAGEDYVRDPDLGADCHGRRMRLELALEQAGERRPLHRQLAARGLGREAIVHARRVSRS